MSKLGRRLARSLFSTAAALATLALTVASNWPDD